MNHKLLQPAIQDFIFEHSKNGIDITKLILAGSPFEGISAQELAQQIQAKYKTKTKLPEWNRIQGIYYPPTLNLEQTSSEATAHYKSQLITGSTLIDLTGGLGIDDYYLAKKVTQLTHCELNTTLSTIAQHNFTVLKATNITTHTGDGLAFLATVDSVDWIYIDPSRRHDQKGKVFFLEDCLPNVPEHLSSLYSKSKNILIKTSPLLDISAGIRSLTGVKEVHVVAVQNEVKELLWVLERGYTGNCTIHSANIRTADTSVFTHTLNDTTLVAPSYTLPAQYLYEPNAAILKGGGFAAIATQYQVQKLHPHSHLYTSDRQIDFPGRRFEVQQILPYQKKVWKKMKIGQANITTRNFPETVASIRKKWNIKEGGDTYLFYTTDCNDQRIVLICHKV